MDGKWIPTSERFPMRETDDSDRSPVVLVAVRYGRDPLTHDLAQYDYDEETWVPVWAEGSWERFEDNDGTVWFWTPVLPTPIVND